MFKPKCSLTIHNGQFTWCTQSNLCFSSVCHVANDEHEPDCAERPLPEALASVPKTQWPQHSNEVGPYPGTHIHGSLNLISVSVQKLKTTRPVYCKQYSLSAEKELGIQPVSDSLLAQGIVVPTYLCTILLLILYVSQMVRDGVSPRTLDALTTLSYLLAL